MTATNIVLLVDSALDSRISIFTHRPNDDDAVLGMPYMEFLGVRVGRSLMLHLVSTPQNVDVAVDYTDIFSSDFERVLRGTEPYRVHPLMAGGQWEYMIYREIDAICLRFSSKGGGMPSFTYRLLHSMGDPLKFLNFLTMQ